MADDALTLSARQGFRDSFRGRFVISDSLGREYSGTANRALEFTIARDDTVLVEVKAVGRTRGLLLTRPRNFRVFFDGVERGSMHYSLLWPILGHALVLDGTKYTIPDGFRSSRSKPLGVRLSWRWISVFPSVNIAREEDLHVGLLVMGMAFVRGCYVEG